MNEFGIVVVTYNRLISLKRLISSLLNAEYLNENIDLIISMDYSGSIEVQDYIETIEWPYGKLKKIYHKEKLGLRKHVLFCGDLTEKYENICVFEDDIMVSKGFYVFAKEATSYYKNNEYVAGISLYQYQWNQYANLSFSPIPDRFDTYFLQVASSWGQVWSSKRWQEFRSWMNKYSDSDLKEMEDLPEAVSSWSNESWLKFHHAYLICSHKYFVYPKVALSTNFSEPGQHAQLDSTYQVELLNDIKYNYIFCNIEEGARYDGYFENKKIIIDGYEKITVDLYGKKKKHNRFFLSTRKLPLKIERNIALRMRPFDLNVINNIEGDGIFLYDGNTKEEISFLSIKSIDAQKKLFIYKVNSRESLLEMWSLLLFKSIIKRIHK